MCASAWIEMMEVLIFSKRNEIESQKLESLHLERGREISLSSTVSHIYFDAWQFLDYKLPWAAFVPSYLKLVDLCPT